jgi:aspartate-semialdehyde dehydrogenase
MVDYWITKDNHKIMDCTIGVLGATGLVGQALIPQLSALNNNLILFASESSVGLEIPVGETFLPIRPLTEEYLDLCDILLTVTEQAVSQPIIECRKNKHYAIIDNAATFRLDLNVPLLIPEINAHCYTGQSLLANPNCTTIQLLLALYPLFKTYGIEECFIASYQSVSGTGLNAIAALKKEMADSVAGRDITAPFYPRQIAANVIPQCDQFVGDWTREELKIIHESSKILEAKLSFYPTCVRVPVYQGHHLAVTVKLCRAMSKSMFKELVEQMPRLCWADHDYPSSQAVVGSDQVYISRVRSSSDTVWSFWLSADNVRVGAATNAMNILKLVLARK